MPGNTILSITDGTTTANLIWHSSANRKYMLVQGGWAPGIAPLREGTLGGRGPYADVEEEIELNILGDTQAEVLSNLQTLTTLLDQAWRFWRRGENVSPVKIQYTPKGSNLLLTALILGRAPGDQTAGVNLPITINKDLGALTIVSVKLRFIRTGLWLNPIAESNTSTLSNNPTVQTVALPSALTISAPTVLTADSNGVSLTAATVPAVILYASAVNRLTIFEAESGTLGPQTTSVADAAGKARGGNVARYTPTVTTLVDLTTIQLNVMDSAMRRVALWAVVRNNSGTTSFQLQAQSPAGAGAASTTPLIPIDTSSLSPRTVFLGVLSFALAPGTCAIKAQASAAAGTLDIDYIVALAVDDERSGALSLPGAALLSSLPFTVDPRILSAATPLVSQPSVVPAAAVGYNGDAMIHTTGGTVYVTIIQPTGTFWVQVNAAGTTVIQNNWTVSRYNAYLSPR
jgi:hypothetical protein